MWRERLRELFAFARRRGQAPPERPEDTPGTLDPLGIPEQQGGVTARISMLRPIRPRKVRTSGADVFDYVLGLLIIGLMSLGGTLWTSKNEKSSSQTGWQTLSPPAWMRRDFTNGANGTSQRRSLRRALQGSGTEREDSKTLLKPDTPPVAKQVVLASYTEEALHAGFHGKVYVIVFVDALGVPEKIEPTSPIPFGLEVAIRDAILQWRFQPAMARGAPVAGKAVLEVPFR